MVHLLLLIGQPSFPGMVMPIDEAPICLPVEEVAVHAGNEVLMEVETTALIVADL